MKRKYVFYVGIVLAGFIASCGHDIPKDAGYTPTKATMKEPGDNTGVAIVVDNSKGKGKFTDVKLTHPLDQKMVAEGKAIFDVKCVACHKLTDERLVGPGWKGITDRRKPEWIMNFTTNTEEMLDKDPAAREMLAKYMVRMPNPILKDDEARKVLEFMRNNDGKN